MPANKDELFTRAAQAAERVTEFQMDVVDKQALLKSARNRLKKAAAEARSLKRQVWEALGGKPRKRKPRERVIATMPDVVLGEDGPETEATGTHCEHGLPYTTSCQKCEREIPYPCWFDGCRKPSVKAVSDFEGATWECCADHMVAQANARDLPTAPDWEEER